jgi:hypothetical protein
MTKSKSALALYDEFMPFYRAWADLPKETEFTEDACIGVAEHMKEVLEILQNEVDGRETETHRKLGEVA